MLVAHTGDWHLTEGPRFSDTVATIEWIVADGAGAGVDLWLVGGDLAGTTVPHAASVNERSELARLLYQMAMSAPVVVVRGNHDIGLDVAIYGRFGGGHRVYVAVQPATVVLPSCAIYCLPYPSKRHAVASGAVTGSFDHQRQSIEGDLRTILHGFRADAAKARDAGTATIGLMHINIGGSIVGGGEVLIGREVELAPGDLVDLGFDAGCLSHIHKAQQMAPGWWYAGSPSAQNFGEESDRKSYNLITVQAGVAPTCELRLTPARRLVTVDLEWVEQDGQWGWHTDTPPATDGMRGAEVRLRVRVPESAVASCPVDQAVARLREIGVHSVSVDRRISASSRIRSEAITIARTTADKIRAYWQSLEAGAPDSAQQARALAHLAEIEQAGTDAVA